MVYRGLTALQPHNLVSKQLSLLLSNSETRYICIIFLLKVLRVINS